MQPMSQAEVDAGEARQWLMQRGWSLDEVLSLEQSVRIRDSILTQLQLGRACIIRNAPLSKSALVVSSPHARILPTRERFYRVLINRVWSPR